ncbi:hypothetical protein [Streptococcus merionis]|uniref:hypothetical protein n=1 Tax=Streptococcus merionis TaxID=400065 RepID=UPI0035193D17
MIWHLFLTQTFCKKEWKIIPALSRSQPSVLVMLYAYYNLIEPDRQKAAKALVGFKKMEASYHLPAEYRTEARSLGYFQEIITRKVYQKESGIDSHHDGLSQPLFNFSVVLTICENIQHEEYSQWNQEQLVQKSMLGDALILRQLCPNLVSINYTSDFLFNGSL